MKTITIDIINERAMKLLQDLELLQLIRVRKDKLRSVAVTWGKRYKGAMTKQRLADIDNQLNELRGGWE